jgi:hypothetical protein
LDTNVSIVTATDQGTIDLSGWKPAGLDFRYDDPAKTRVQVYTRKLKKGKSLPLPTGNWTGAVLIFD